MTPVAIFGFVIYNNWIQWVENHLLACPSKKFLHIECPGCGFQRSVIELIKGNFMESLRLYPASIPVILLLVFTGLHIKFKYSNGPVIIKTLFIGSALIIVINYIYKIINHQIIA